MKNFTLLILLLLTCRYSAIASHAMGGEITYVCLGNNQYEVTFTFYRDCVGIPAPLSMSIDLTEGVTSTVTSSFNLTPTPVSPIQVHTVCHTEITTCNGGSYLGIEKWVYTGIITLPSENNEWIISHSENARNAALTTISGAGSDNLFVYAVINNSNSICNNSPVFLTDPIPITCVNTPFCFNPSAYDADGDSLSFSLITPRIGLLPSDTVTYLSGYSTQQPLISQPLAAFNPANGELCMVVQQPDVSPIALLVSEFRNGVLIGQVERDVQLTALPCNNTIPNSGGFNGTFQHSLYVCATQSNCFYITAFDPDTANTTFVAWDLGIPNASATHSFGKRDTLFMCWTPSDSDTISNPHTFNVTITDDNCPYFGIQSSSYTIYVTPSGICNPNSISDINDRNVNLKFYPQPASDNLFIDLKEFATQKELTLHIFNVTGEEIYSKKISDAVENINAELWANTGFYLASITDSNNRILRRGKILFIKQE